MTTITQTSNIPFQPITDIEHHYDNTRPISPQLTPKITLVDGRSNLRLPPNLTLTGYRGMEKSDPRYNQILTKGVIFARNFAGHQNSMQHNDYDTNSIFVSFSLSPIMGKFYSGHNGLVIKAIFPYALTVSSSDRYLEGEILIRYGAKKVQVFPVVQGKVIENSLTKLFSRLLQAKQLIINNNSNETAKLALATIFDKGVIPTISQLQQIADATKLSLTYLVTGVPTLKFEPAALQFQLQQLAQGELSIIAQDKEHNTLFYYDSLTYWEPQYSYSKNNKTCRAFYVHHTKTGKLYQVASIPQLNQTCYKISYLNKKYPEDLPQTFNASTEPKSWSWATKKNIASKL